MIMEVRDEILSTDQSIQFQPVSRKAVHDKITNFVNVKSYEAPSLDIPNGNSDKMLKLVIKILRSLV